MWGRAVERAINDLCITPEAFIAATFVPVLPHLTRQRRVLYATDDWMAGAALMDVDAGWLESSVRQQVEAASTLIAVSAAILDVLAPSPTVDDSSRPERV